MIDFKSPNDCADCEWLADETDGEITLCNECEQNLLELEKSQRKLWLFFRIKTMFKKNDYVYQRINCNG